MKAILIGGCGRSGTTMLGSMLGSHSRVLAVPEFHFKTAISWRLGAELSPAMVPRALALLREDLHFKSWGINDVLASALPKDFDGSYRQFVEYFVHHYGRRSGTSSFEHWVDHTPANIRRAGFLLQSFPGAKMLHVVRDGRAVAASVLPLDWGPHSLKQVAEGWLLDVGAGLAAEAEFPEDRILRVHFEKLVDAPRASLEKICRFLDLEYEAGMEDGAGFRVPEASTRQHALVGSPPDKRRVDAWQDALTPRQIELFEYYAGSMLESLGYRTSYGIRARPPSAREHFTMTAADAVLPYWRRLRYLKRHGRGPLAAVWKKLRGGKID